MEDQEEQEALQKQEKAALTQMKRAENRRAKAQHLLETATSARGRQTARGKLHKMKEKPRKASIAEGPDDEMREKLAVLKDARAKRDVERLLEVAQEWLEKAEDAQDMLLNPEMLDDAHGWSKELNSTEKQWELGELGEDMVFARVVKLLERDAVIPVGYMGRAG